MRNRRPLGLFVAAVCVLPTVTAVTAVTALRWGARRVRRLEQVEGESVALVLGAQALPGGRPSRFLAGRLEVARRLHADGRVARVLVSGDDRAGSNHEATTMRDWLVARGVPGGSVLLDPRGYDTHDSCWNARTELGLRRLVVVSQSYHLPRALLTCRLVGIQAVGVGDESVRGTRVWRRGVWRERVAVLKLALDLLPGRALRDRPWRD